MRMVKSGPHRILAAALVLPAGYTGQVDAVLSGQDALAKRQVEQAAMDAVLGAERALGHTVRDVAADKCGWDITSTPPRHDGKIPEARHIEVKGRVRGSATVTVTRNEVCYGLNQRDKFILALVFVDGDRVDGPHYVRHPFEVEPDWHVTSVNLDVAKLMSRAEKPA